MLAPVAFTQAGKLRQQFVGTSPLQGIAPRATPRSWAVSTTAYERGQGLWTRHERRSSHTERSAFAAPQWPSVAVAGHKEACGSHHRDGASSSLTRPPTPKRQDEQKRDETHLTQAQAHYSKARKQLDELAVGTPGRRLVHPQQVAKAISDRASLRVFPHCSAAHTRCLVTSVRTFAICAASWRGAARLRYINIAPRSLNKHSQGASRASRKAFGYKTLRATRTVSADLHDFRASRFVGAPHFDGIAAEHPNLRSAVPVLLPA